MSKISITDIAKILVIKNGLELKAAEQFVAAIFDIVQRGLERDSLVKIKGLGTFKIIGVEARESVNVNTGERVVIGSHGKVTFTPDATMKELVNKPFSQFETVVLNDGIDFADMVENETEGTASQEQEEMLSEPLLEEHGSGQDGQEQEASEDEGHLEDVTEDAPNDTVDATDDTIAEDIIIGENVTEPTDLSEPTDEEMEERQEEPSGDEQQELVAAPEVQTYEQSDESSECEEEKQEEVPDEQQEIIPEESSVTLEESSDVSEEEEENEEEDEEQHSGGMMKWLLFGGISFVLILAAFYGGYVYGTYTATANNQEQTGAKHVAPDAQEKAPETVTQPTDTTSLKSDTDTTTTTQAAAEETAVTQEEDSAKPQEGQGEAKTETETDAEADYQKYEAMDNRVRTGAYRIIGTDHVRTVKKGETLARIARHTLGEGMECYIEVYNGLERGAKLQEGQKVKIPKLKLKPKLRKK